MIHSGAVVEGDDLDHRPDEIGEGSIQLTQDQSEIAHRQARLAPGIAEPENLGLIPPPTPESQTVRLDASTVTASGGDTRPSVRAGVR